MFTRNITATMLLAVLLVFGAGVGVAQEDTFTLSVGAYNCDADPQQNSNVTCVPNGGTEIIVTLESGEFVGSCVLETFDTPNGGVGSGCGVDGVPFNSTLVLYEDESTLPAGYVATNSPQVFQTTDIIPGGGDGPVITFTNVLVDQGLADAPAEEPTVSDVADDNSPAEEEPADDGPASERDEEPTASEREVDARESDRRAAAIYTGSCDRLDDVAAELPNIVDPQGRAVGQASAIEAATSSTTVDVSLDVLLDEEHAIVVVESNTLDSDVIACGDIGGVDNDDGELVVGLSEVDGSGFTGMVYLAYSGADASQTSVSIFLAEGLADTP